MSRTYPKGETNTHLISNDIKDIADILFCSHSSKSLAELEFKNVAGRVVVYDPHVMLRLVTLLERMKMLLAGMVFLIERLSM